MRLTILAPICNETVSINNMGVMDYLRYESRNGVDPKGERWSLFARNSPQCINTGSLIRLTYRASRSTPSSTTFTGVLLAIRRGKGEPTIVVRGIVDDVAMEQVFCVFSPLLEKVELLKPAFKKSTRKLYSLRDRPSEIIKLQKSVVDTKVNNFI